MGFKFIGLKVIGFIVIGFRVMFFHFVFELLFATASSDSTWFRF